MRVIGFALTILGMMFRQGEGTAAERPRASGAPGGTAPAQARQSRRLARRAPRPAAERRPCPSGRHVVAVQDGVVFLDGRRISGPHPVHILQAPTWREDGGALAWVERDVGVTRLQVLPDLQPGTQPLAFPIPAHLSSQRVLWSGASKVVMGAHVLAPRAIASWTES